MYFGLSEEQIFFQDNIKKFLEENSSVDILRKIAADDRTFAKDIHDGIVNFVYFFSFLYLKPRSFKIFKIFSLEITRPVTFSNKFESNFSMNEI